MQRSIESRSICSVSASQSAKTGRQPACTMLDSSVLKLRVEAISSEPGERSSNRSEKVSAELPEFSIAPWRLPSSLEQRRSDSTTFAPSRQRGYDPPMALFGKPTYNRADMLARAAKAQSKGRLKQAITWVRRVLDQEPDNPVILAKLAALLAQTKQPAEAREKFAAAGDRYVKQGFPEKALGVYKQAVVYLSDTIEFWEAISGLNLARERKADALAALLEGRTHFRRRAQRPLAIRLLRGAVKIEPGHFDVTLDLARLLAKSGARAESDLLYQGLCQGAPYRRLQRVRFIMFRSSPTPMALWRWLRAAIRGV
jgi:tetratricopeptide (TPR) repeat protein